MSSVASYLKKSINFDYSQATDGENNLDVRNYDNDMGVRTSIPKRVALSIVPFLMFHSALRLPISLAMDSLRIVNQTGYKRWSAVAALGLTILKSSLGSQLIAINDILIEIQKLPSSSSRSEAAAHLIKISNNILYLALCSCGGYELYLLSSAMNATVALLNSVGDFKKGYWIEGTAQLLMTAVRLHQLNEKCNYLKKIGEIKKYFERVFLNSAPKNNLSTHEISPIANDRSKYGNSTLLSEIFIKRHSGTNFDARPLNEDQIVALVESARWTPSSFNDQPWNFIFCDRYKHPESYAKIIESFYGQEWAEVAPLLVISVVNPTFRYKGEDNNEKHNIWAQYDTGAAALSMSLQATQMGLIAHQIGGFDPEIIQEEFNLPKGLQPLTIIAFGYEKAPLGSGEEQERTRRPTEDNFFFGTWGRKFLTQEAG